MVVPCIVRSLDYRKTTDIESRSIGQSSSRIECRRMADEEKPDTRWLRGEPLGMEATKEASSSGTCFRKQRVAMTC